MERNNKIKTFRDLFFKAVEPNSFISSFITGHLMIEFLLIKIVEVSSPKLSDFAESLNHQKLIQLVSGLGLISDDVTETLLSINRMRNKLVHDISFMPTIQEYKQILLLAQRAFSDMTDGISQALDEIEGKTRIEDCDGFIFLELFIQTSYDLHGIYNELGGDIENFNFSYEKHPPKKE